MGKKSKLVQVLRSIPGTPYVVGDVVPSEAFGEHLGRLEREGLVKMFEKAKRTDSKHEAKKEK